MSAAEGLLAYVLLAQAVMGGVDTILNHELLARLPHDPAARREIGLHSVREATYGTLFIGLGWLEWHGALAWIVAAPLLLEVAVTAADELEENRTRVLPQNERVLHVFLTLNYGILLALLAPTLVEWSRLPAALEPAAGGWTRWALAAFGASSFGWSIRDLIAWRRLAAAPVRQ